MAAGTLRDHFASRDLETVVMAGTVPLTADAPPNGIGAVYARRGDGPIELVSRLPDGSVPTVSAQLPYGISVGTSNAASPPAMAYRNAVSENGRYVLFTVATPNPAGMPVHLTARALYVRDLVTGVTRELAAPAAPAANLSPGGWFPSPTNNNASIAIANVPDGYTFAARKAPVAYFRSGFNLVPGATGTAFNKVYRADLTTGDLSFDAELNGPPVAVSDDGGRVMFLRPTGAVGADPWELRVWSVDAPGTSILLGSIPGTNNNSGMVRAFRSTGDGKTWLFTASGNLDPDRVNNKVTAHQLYRWVAGETHPTCLSCESTDGVGRFFGVNLGVGDTYSSESVRSPAGTTGSVRKLVAARPNRAMSTNGDIVAFDSPDRLVPEDTNDVRDVYLWDKNAESGSELQLVTSGQGLSPSYYLDMDPEGRNIFFATQDGLVDADKDLAYDVYVARKDGGDFIVDGESCVGETCRTPVIPNPQEAVIASNILMAVTEGKKQPSQTGTPKLRVRSVRSSSRWVRVGISTPSAGRIRVSGRWVRTRSRTAKRVATYHVRVPLRAAARRRLARGTTVKVSLRVQFTPKGSKRTSKVSASVSVRKGR